MRIANVLSAKGSVVATVTPEARVAVVLAEMATQGVGAVVVVGDGAVAGMVWERDLIRLLHELGEALIHLPVSEIMNVDVISCDLTDEVDDVLRIMTKRRIRHLPVILNNELRGIVSMGDLVKARIGELEADRAYLQEVNQQLREAYADLATADEALQEQQQAKDRFIATLSHELRNPLAAVLAATELLALDTGDHPALAVLQRQVNALVRMTDDLLDASRALTGRLEVVRRPLDLRTTVDAAVKDIRPEYARTDRTLRLSLPAEPIVVDGDGIRLAQMLGNLLSNARKYTHPGGTVRVELTGAAGQAVLTVRDDGIGFEPAAADKLFEVFARAVPSGMTDAGGLGLGLAIVRSIVELHGGTVSAHSQGPATGAEFRVELPLTHSLDSRPAQLLSASQAPAALRMLIIEDNVDLAATYRTLLERRGHAVTVVHTGADGLAAAHQQHFDLILCDLGLPDITGYEVARRLRADPDSQPARLVAHSGYSRNADRQQSLQAGFDAHLTKPIAISDLEHLLNQPG